MQTDDILERLRIRELIDLYIDSLNHRSWQAMEDLWTIDCIWSIGEPHNLRFEGRKNVMDFIREFTERSEFVVQMGHAVTVELTHERRAKSRHLLHTLSSSFELIGTYYDRLVKGVDGLWRFASRDVQVTYFFAGAPPGRIYRAMQEGSSRDLPSA